MVNSKNGREFCLHIDPQQHHTALVCNPQDLARHWALGRSFINLGERLSQGRKKRERKTNKKAPKTLVSQVHLPLVSFGWGTLCWDLPHFPLSGPWNLWLCSPCGSEKVPKLARHPCFDRLWNRPLESDPMNFCVLWTRQTGQGVPPQVKNYLKKGLLLNITPFPFTFGRSVVPSNVIREWQMSGIILARATQYFGY